MGRGGFALPSVYFTKWVAIQNSRLWSLYICVYIILVALVAASIALFQVYFVPVEPHLRLQLWNDVTGLTGTACPTDNFDYDPGNGTGNWQFMRPRCATSCALGPPEVGTGACVTERQIIRQDNHVLFFATAFNEKVDLRYHNNMTWMAEHFDTWLAEEQANTNATVPGSPCPFPVNTETASTARQCRHHASYLMPQQWFEALHAKFTLEYQVEAPDGALADVAGMTTVVKNADGGTFKEFAAGQVLSLSVKEALEAAGLALSDVIDAQDDIPNNQQSARIQNVGANLVIHLEVTNNGESPTCTVTIQGIPGFTVQEESDLLDAHGSMRVRLYSGIRFTFRPRGSFKWFRADKFVYIFTMCVVWLQLPGMIFFEFAMRCLGTLSEAYAGFTYEHIDMSKEVIGVGARTMSYSFGQAEVSDLEEESEGKLVFGASPEAAKRRMHQILKGHKVLGASERKLFTEFFLSNAASGLPAGREAICFEDFMYHLGSNENLRGVADVVAILDPNRSGQNALEYAFPDTTFKALGKNIRIRGNEPLLQHDTKMIVMNRLTLHSSIWAAQRCNLTRCMLGQEALEVQLEKLQTAGSFLHDFATKLRSGFRTDEPGSPKEDLLSEDNEPTNEPTKATSPGRGVSFK